MSVIQLKCVLEKVIDTKSGIKEGKAWNYTNILVKENNGSQYPKNIAIQVWGNDGLAVKSMDIGTGLLINLSFESREYNNRWYTDIKSVKISNDI